MRHWLRSYGLMLRWNAIRMRVMLPLFAVVQVGLGIGVIVGFGYLLPTVDQTSALFLSTGGPTIGLITLGLVLAPQLVAQSRSEGAAEFDRTLPVPQMATLAADITGWVLAALPGIVISLVVATLRYHIVLSVSPLVVPAFMLVALTATAVGYSIAYGLPPVLVNLASQVLIFFTLLFSPVSFPVDRLPGWLQAVHVVLPIRYMAQVIRETLSVPTGGVSGTPFLILAAWAVAGLALTYRVMSRRL